MGIFEYMIIKNINISLAKMGSKNPMWRKYKDKVTVQTIHRRIEKEYPKPDKCELCGSIRKLELSNKDHKYSFNIKDYQWICKKCHFRYDNHEKYLDAGRKIKKVMTPEWRKKLRISHLGLIPWNKGRRDLPPSWNSGMGKERRTCPKCFRYKSGGSRQCRGCRLKEGWLQCRK